MKNHSLYVKFASVVVITNIIAVVLPLRAAVPFTEVVIQNGQTPWGKALADLDGDGYLDAVIASVNPVDGTASNIANGTTAPDNITSTTAVTTTAGDLIFGTVMDDTGVTTIQPGTGFTLRGSVNGTDLATEDKILGTAGSVAATWTFGTAHRYLAQMIAFKAAGQ